MPYNQHCVTPVLTITRPVSVILFSDKERGALTEERDACSESHCVKLLNPCFFLDFVELFFFLFSPSQLLSNAGVNLHQSEDTS